MTTLIMKLKSQMKLYKYVSSVDIQFKEELSLKLKSNLVLLRKTIFTTIFLFFPQDFSGSADEECMYTTLACKPNASGW